MPTRPAKLLHLLLIFLTLAGLAAAAWYYTNAREPVAGLPMPSEPPAPSVPDSPEICAKAGGVWNECASACPPDAQACIQVCVRKCEGIDDGKKIIDVYFPNSKLDPDHLDCEKVFPVKRAIDVGADGPTAVLSGAVNELLKGPTDAEQEAGYFTTLAEGTTLKNLFEESSKGQRSYRLVFSPELDDAIAGSCRVTAIRSQIASTVAPDGAPVTIVAQGKTAETTLQP